ncbi:MAG: redoxin domain-containing protein [Planctomycetales bacterium]|nr:redoxin domain-containing protein [Planctomycetales bacterium]
MLPIPNLTRLSVSGILSWASIFWWLCFWMAADATCQEESVDELVPRNLLKLIHAPEVYEELALTVTQKSSLRSFLEEIDGPWFRSRNLPANEQLKVLDRLEWTTQQWLTKHLKSDQLSRLKQLEYQSQGVRMMLVPAVSSRLSLSKDQISRLTQLARRVDRAQRDYQQAILKQTATEELKSAVVRATEDEQGAIRDVLNSDQQQILVKIIGSVFDTAKLRRIYPLAPELIDSREWVNTSGLSLKELRGKVILLHFYAFQCSNCQANFGLYQRWQDEFGDQVIVLGIQSPETSAEQDPTRVRAAAVEKGMCYPILIDINKENWNAWSNTMWPTVYVIDQDGFIRQWWQGELNYQGAKGDQVIRDLVNDLLSSK